MYREFSLRNKQQKLKVVLNIQKTEVKDSKMIDFKNCSLDPITENATQDSSVVIGQILFFEYVKIQKELDILNSLSDPV